MKRILLPLFFSIVTFAALAQSQSVSIGTNSINPKAVLWLEPTGGQGLLLPAIRTAERNAMALTAAEEGMVVYDVDTKQILFWNGTEWRASGAAGGTAEVDGVIGNEVTQVSNTGGLELTNNNNNLTVGIVPGTADGQVLRWNDTTKKWELSTVSGSGETNTASNVGVGGVGTFRQKTGVNLEFKNINAASNRVAVTNDATNNEIDIDVNQANLSIAPSQLSAPVGNAQITDNAINSAKIQDGTITGADLSSSINITTTGTLSATGTNITLNPSSTLSLRGANWPPANATGVLTNDGTGILTWVPGVTSSLDALTDVTVSSPADAQILIKNGAAGDFTNRSVTGDISLANSGAATISNSGTTGNNIISAVNNGATTGTFNAARIGDMDASKITTGVFGLARGGTGLTGTPGNGQLLIGNGTGYTLSTLTAGTGIDIVNTAGGISISNSMSTFSTPNVIPKGDGTSLVASSIFEDASGQVAIGHTAPDNLLDVRSAGPDDPALIVVGNSDNTSRLWMFSGRQSDPSPFIMWKTGADLRFATDQAGFTEVFRFSNRGALGVGPTADFGTAGQVLMSQGPGSSPVWSNATSGWGLTGNLGTTPATNYIGTGDAQDFVFRTSGSERMRILANGDIGVGHSAPDSRFHSVSNTGVASNRALRGSAQGPSFQNFGVYGDASGGTHAYGVYGFASGGASSNWAGYFEGNTAITGALGVGSDPGNSFGTTGQVLTSQGPGTAPVWSNATSGWSLLGNTGTTPATNFIGTRDAQDLTFRTNDVERLRITQGGNVGIGVTVPLSLVDVRGPESSSIDLSNSANTIKLRSVVNSGSGAQIGTVTNHRLSLFTNNNAALTISETGNVGIGTAIPGNPLEIVHSSLAAIPAVVIDNTAGVGTQNIVDFRFSGGTQAIVRKANGGGFFIESDNNIELFTAATSRLAVLFSGEVGVGTQTPTERLDVVGNMKFSGALMPNNLPGASGEVLTSQGPGLPPIWSSGGSGWGLNGNTGTAAGTNFLGTRDAQDLVFKTNDIEVARFTSAGHFGIGTQTPAEKVEIASTITPRIRMKNLATTTLGDSFIEFGHDDGSGGFVSAGAIGDPGSGDYLQLSSPNNIIFNTNFSQRLSINSNGMVEISSPVSNNHLLSVMNLNGPGPASSISGTVGARIYTGENTATQSAAIEARAGGSGGTQYIGLHATAEGGGGAWNRGIVASAYGSTGTNTGIDVFSDQNTGNNIGVAINVGGTQTDPKFGLMINASGSGTKTGLQVTGEDVNSFSGNVGIGTTNPTSKLEVVGDVKIPAANNYSYSSPKTKTLGVSHAAFVLAESTSTVRAARPVNVNNHVFALRTQGGTSGVTCHFVAPIYLPDGATVTGVSAYIQDTDVTIGNNVTIRLYSQPLGGSSTLEHATLGTDDSDNAVLTESTSSISSPLIDNSTRTYFLSFQTKENNSNLALVNVTITYTVSNVD